MSKRKSFGRFTAMSLAGISAVSSVAIVAEAAYAYSAYVYEFQYTGAKSIAKNAYAQALANANKFVVEDTGVTLTSEFAFGLDEGKFRQYTYDENGDVDPAADHDSATIADNFGLGENNTLWFNNDNGDWKYKDKVTGLAVVAEEQYLNREDVTDDGGFIAFFKSKSERDAAKTKIIADIKSEYTSKYNAALSALKADLSTASKALKEANIDAAELERDDAIDALEAVRDAAIKTAEEARDAVLDDENATSEDKSEARKEYSEAVSDAREECSEGIKLAKEICSKKTKVENENYKLRNEVITTVGKEFQAVYGPSNFDYDKGFDIDDTAPEVKYTTVSGGVVFEKAEYTGRHGEDIDDLTNAYYRSSGTYIAPGRYAFTGELTDKANISKSNYDISVNWIAFTDLIRGNSSSGNTSGSGNNDSSSGSSSSSSTTTSSWLPSAGYRVPNASNISYLGKNGYWYTSIAAAEAYGGGYAGQSKTSNYNDVKNAEKVYFDALTGSYTSGDGKSAYDYLVAENKKDESTTTNNANDPYYYYYLMGGMGNTTGSSTIDPDAPTIYGSSKKSGWNRILSVVKTKAAGSTVTIDMNAATTIPEDIIKAAVSKDVIIKAVNSNGSIVTINPDDVKYTDAINVGIDYNTGAISKSLRNKALKVNKGAVSTTQISVGEDGALCADITATVKLSAKRAGCTVKAYRLSSNGKKLTVEAKATVKSNGSVNLKLDNGGDYLLVVID